MFSSHTPTPVTLVHQLFEHAALTYPDSVAVEYEGQQLTYRQLENKANNLCQALLQYAPQEAVIGISTSRGPEMIVGVLAILKAGKAYLPLDPNYPAQRLRQVIQSSGVSTCLSAHQDQVLFQELGLVSIQSDTQHPYTGLTASHTGSTAYVLYTSGSTGEPKGVCMGHAALLNLLHWQNAQSRATSSSRTLQFAPLSFDVSFQEIFATLSTGGRLLLIKEELRLDLAGLLLFIKQHAVNRLFLPFVALQYLAEAAVSEQLFPVCLNEIMTAGEQLKITPQLEQLFSALPDCVLYNQYGPTECHVVTEFKLEGATSAWPPLPPIGKPISNTFIVVVDGALHPVPAGSIGEICLGGACLAEGYLNQPLLTAEKFITQQTTTGEQIRLYRTGDLGRFLADGNVEFLGRQDDQVKIRGHRIELGEVEAVLNTLDGIKQAIVVAREYADNQKKLVAYLVSETTSQDSQATRKTLEQRLPDYMVPSAFVWMQQLPLTTSGKVDRKLLPAPELKRPELSALYRKPHSALETTIAALWANLLQVDKVGLDDNFFELGGNSLLAQKTVAVLKTEHQLTLPITKLYQHPTVAETASLLGQHAAASPAPKQAASPPLVSHGEVAIIGMAGRFPGADSIADLWQLLKQGKETTRFFTDDELDATIPAHVKNDPLYVKARGIINNPDQFDAAFFDLNPKLAALMDPQHRVFLEIAWEALEQTGYLPQHYDGSIGVFAGCGNNTYYQRNVLGNQHLVDQVGSFQVMTANEKDYIASRTAYQLNLKGPAVSVYSACSTSLLAITQAVQSIRSGHCTLALAGGASITAPVFSGHLYEEGAMLSRTGHCRPFDAQAQGTVFSDGAGVVLLKSLAAAQQDGDTIYAVIKGVGVNNDGRGKGSFTAPSAAGQAGAITMALQDAGVAATSIGYVEAHGTATPLGDPIEIEGLTMAFGDQVAKQSCALGSIKSNMGHLTPAAGVAGLIKATLALHHKQLPPSLGFNAPNPSIDFAASPFFITTALTDWQSSEVRRAGVSSFGVGGTNVHVILEEFENVPPPSSGSRAAQLVTWSAKSVGSREAYASNLADYLEQEPLLTVADVAYTLQKTRGRFAHRRFAVAATPAELAAKLRAQPSATDAQTLQQLPGEVVFLFPGQGAQYLQMGRTLYETEAVYRQAVDTCADLLLPHLGTDIRHTIYPAASTSAEEDTLKNTRYAQPALFVTEYALATLWMSWGISPSVLCGHSIGEFVAAHLAGVFSLADALSLVATRGRMVSELPRGSMLSVRMEAEKLLALLPEDLSVAAINSRVHCVVAGADEHVATFALLLDEQKVPNRLLATSHAFHSYMMNSIVADFQQVVEGISLSRPQKPVVSTVSGTWLTDAQATDPRYWASHLRLTVRFADALETIFQQEQPLLLEVGPGNTLATLARQQRGTRPGAVHSSFSGQKEPLQEQPALLEALGHLWLHGLEPNWPNFYANQTRARLALPTYAFDRKYCWVEPAVASTPIAPTPPIVPTPIVSAPLVAAPRPSLPPAVSRKDSLLGKVKTILEDASGIEMDGVTPTMTLLEIGLDSLLITQVAITLKKEFKLPITFRQLNQEYSTLEALVSYLDSQLPPEIHQAPAAQPVLAPVAAAILPPAQVPAVPANDTILGLVAQQLHLLAQQVTLLQGSAQAVPTASANALPASAAPSYTLETAILSSTASALPEQPAGSSPELTPEEEVELKKPFGATARIERQATELSELQQDFVWQLTSRYNQKTRGSKAYSQQHRAHMADPRVVSGFKPLTKEVVYPLVVNRSKGSKLWDIDGNQYIDALNGFGSSMLGHQPTVVTDALHQQIETGYEVGPQHELAGEVSALLCEFTGFDRVALCSTGSEAVLGTMRVARMVTGRSLIVAFSGSYHGINDEVLVRGTKKLKSYPAAPGIMPEAVHNMLILDYGTDESLRIIKERAHELAAVLVEPVQSRRPEFVPIEFLKQVRAITKQSGTALIFDEVITGFRMHPGGAQALFGIKADLASYGKVVGGGLPIGVIAGHKKFMDALDGGFWQYDDASYPEVGVTYFAGTFVRHPLALAATKATLLYMKEKGPALQETLTAKTNQLVEGINQIFKEERLPAFAAQFGSLWKIKFKKEIPYSELLFTLMREKGIHIWDGFPCFMTEAHTLEEIELLISLFQESVNEMIQAGFFPESPNHPKPTPKLQNLLSVNQPPVPGARLGRDHNGNPAWYISNPEIPGKYLKIDIN
ncbi:amino acid adenylation domain-containing protein [Hymenobacter tibetensis]|uniref:Amino acid adenylation domain-containing protein n=1 Tax=Hymenobacter tibetensis TaxID=497967 RepID=A0ABY4D373_9BACT|nr:polyketide synthase [Hymenobacter tibetensis]UOG76482.1 amino acid adenylation domain-containing protein [Hymenobacter tibetensis]